MTDMTGSLTTHAIAQGIRDDREKATRARWAASQPATWNESTVVPIPAALRGPASPIRRETRAAIYEAKKFIETLQHENLGQLPPNLFNALRAIHDAIELVADDLDGRAASPVDSGDTVGGFWSNRQRVG
ncbi:hypothetical protein [Diaminobutyricibacter sp. McL0608]|uniref:hypothetical protein n=1 Tax=Leifsonia sp. McL0608 TaxID=3143537 RepID=UPI0031F2D7CF